MKNIDGTTIVDEKGEPLAASTLCTNALLFVAQGENLQGTDKLTRSKLAEKIFPGGEIELSIDEASTLKACIDKLVTHPRLYSEILRVIEGA